MKNFVCFFFGFLYVSWAPLGIASLLYDDDLFQEHSTDSDPKKEKKIPVFPSLSQDQLSKIVLGLISSPHTRGVFSLSTTNTEREEPKSKQIDKPKFEKKESEKIQKKLSKLISHLMSSPSPFPSVTSIDLAPQESIEHVPPPLEPMQPFLPPISTGKDQEKTEEKIPLSWEERLAKLETKYQNLENQLTECHR
ncbi:hypothetical protein [Holospora curviuscula]|uniref:Uncharacterized protein n=1 Tax=Holospora curviuscula TaxID=1082868 RepID=A0A2S5R7C8_9PROT|nr:hypothetical protein [Holospora curviuscula]PPE03214.1 hypothetical protein HCUR_01354 [Holospora curviuscula]